MNSFKLTKREEIELKIFTDFAKKRLSEEIYSPGQRLSAFISGERLDRIPFQLFGYLSHLIGENIYKFFFDPIVRYKSTCAQIIRWGSVEVQNATRINSYLVGESLGAELKYSEDRPPSTKKYIINYHSDLEKLHIPDLKPFIEKDIWSLNNIKIRFKDIIGPPCTFLYPPFSWAATYLRESSQFLMEIYDNPSFVHKLCRFATDLELKVSKELAEKTGCAFFMPDGFCELLSPEQYQEFALPYTAELINALPESLFYIPVPSKFTQITSFYDLVRDHKKLICMGSSLSLKNPLKNLNDLSQFCEILINLDRPFQIAINQTTLKLATEEEVENDVRELIMIGMKGNIMFRTDVIDSMTPPQNIEAFTRAIKKYGKW